MSEMRRYCMELHTHPERVTVHEQRCGEYALSSLLSQGRVVDIGAHCCAACALASVRDDYPQAQACACLQGNTARRRAPLPRQQGWS